MAKHLHFLSLALCLTLLVGSPSVIGQQLYSFSNNGIIEVKGTSTLHDWHMQLATFESRLSIDFYNDSVVISPSVVSALSTELISESKLMTKKAHTALNTDKFKRLTFEVFKKQALYLTENTNQTITGNLSITGVKKLVKFSSNIKYLNNQFVISGELEIKMSDFGITPPTALMGTIKTDDEIKVIYHLTIDFLN